MEQIALLGRAARAIAWPCRRRFPALRLSVGAVAGFAIMVLHGAWVSPVSAAVTAAASDSQPTTHKHRSGAVKRPSTVKGSHASSHAPKAEPAKAEKLDAEQAQALRAAQAAQREQLHEKLEALRHDIAQAEASRSEVVDALSNSERAISDANRKLRDLGQQHTAVRAQLGDIGQRQAQVGKEIAAQQSQLARLLREQYLSGGEDPFKLLFSGDDPNRVQRDLQFLSYVSRAQANLLRDLNQNRDRLHDLASQAQSRNAELALIQQSQEAERQNLMRDQASRRDTLTKISEKLKAQQVQVGALERDDKRLSQVVAELGRIIERQERESKERERQFASLKQKRTAPPPQETGEVPPEQPGEAAKPATRDAVPRNELVPDAGFSGNFARLRGRMRLPLRGDLAARFGSTRAEGGPTWKGLFIRAAEGSEVRSIAPGRVVFAEWLRGFGNLLIVDHGDQYLSIYGNNESLLKQLGDIVQSGDVIATVGNSGGNPETGLYFELRYQGRPFDPLAWASLK